MSKPSRSKRKEQRQKGVRALERAAVAPPERAAEERARAEAVLAATRPKTHVAVPDTPITSPISSATKADAEGSGEPRDSDAGEEAAATSSRSTKVEKKAAQSRIPLVLAGLVALAFLVVFAASGGFSSKDDGKGKPVTVISATPTATPAATPSATPTSAPSSDPPAPAPSSEPTTTASAEPTAAPATTAAPTATPTAAPATTAAPAATPAATPSTTAAAPPAPKPAPSAAAAPKPVAPKPRPQVPADPY